MKREVVFFLIILLGIVLRFWKLDIPLLEFVPSRQIQTAEITQNLIKSDFDIFHPYVNYYGNDTEKYLLAEFPVYNLIVANLEILTGIENEITGRLTSIISFVICTIFLYLLAQNLFNKTIALLSTIFFTFSPLNFLTSRSFQPDEMMLASSLASIFFFYKWSRFNKLQFLVAALISLMVANLTKISSLEVLVLPISYILRKYRPKYFFQIFILVFVVTLTPVVLWLRHAALFSRDFQLATAHGFRISEFFRPEVFLDLKYYTNILGFEMNLVLLPIGIFLFTIGLSKKLTGDQKILYYWLFGVIFYYLTFNIHIMSHEYYHLPIVPVASIFIALGFNIIIKSFPKSIFSKTFFLLLLLSISLIASMMVIKARAYHPIERFSNVINVGKRVENLTKPEDLIIGLMDEGPTLVHYSNRIGWGFEVDPKKIQSHREFIGLKNELVDQPVDRLEYLKSKGAVIFAASYKWQFLTNRDFSSYMYNKYPILEETDEYIIFNLN